VSVFFASHLNLIKQFRNTASFFINQQRKDIQMFRGFAKKDEFAKIDTLPAALLPGRILKSLLSTSGGYG